MQPQAREQLLVLLVEDDADLAEVTQALLQREGLRVAVAHDGLEGLDLIEKLHPQVVITDLVMPVLDGLELIRRHAARPAPRAPVIAVSAVGARLRAARDLSWIPTSSSTSVRWRTCGCTRWGSSRSRRAPGSTSWACASTTWTSSVISASIWTIADACSAARRAPERNEDGRAWRPCGA